MDQLIVMLPLGEIHAGKLRDLADIEGQDLVEALKSLIEREYQNYESTLAALYAGDTLNFTALCPDSDDEIPF